MRQVRVFVSSPGDVDAERRRVDNVIARLNGEFSDAAQFRPVRWETRFYGAHEPFQPQIPLSIDCDIVIGIFWSRLGTELPPEFPPDDDGRPWPSGTAYEILTAIRKRRAGGEIPDVYVFRKTAPVPLAAVDAGARADALVQMDLLDGFWRTWFRSDSGSFKAAFHSFDNTDVFERRVEELLRQWLSDHVASAVANTWPIELKGSPFRGLLPFDSEHASVFFGRARETTRAVEALKGAAADGAAAILVIGASGSGKSSLALAGVAPRLMAPGVVPHVDRFRTAAMRPLQHGGAFEGLAQRLFRAEALPELAGGDHATPAELAAALAGEPEVATRPILRALDRAARSTGEEEAFERPVRTDLLLVVDQLEELFAYPQAEAERFALLLKAVAETGRVWIVATLRADFYDRALALPGLHALKDSAATIDLLPPGPAELAEIVRAPAQAAGLIYEDDRASAETLDERILRDAAPDMLPLMQFMLQRLFEERQTDPRAQAASDAKSRTPSQVLSFATYRRLGGLDGAIDAEAERALARVGETEQAALPRLLRRLTVFTSFRGDDGRATARPAYLDAASEPRGALALIDALVAARILLVDDDESGRATVRLAHERLLGAWKRAAAIVADSRDFLRRRSDAEAQERRWRQAGQSDDLLIPAGLPLAEARTLLERADEIEPDLARYLEASVAADAARVASMRARARRVLMLSAAATVAFACLAGVAGVLGWRSTVSEKAAVAALEAARTAADAARAARTEADANASRAQTEATKASAEARKSAEQLRLARLAQERFVAAQAARVKLERPEEARAALLEMVARRAGYGVDPPLRETASTFYDLDKSDRRILALPYPRSFRATVRWSPDGLRLLTFGTESKARVWDAATGALLLLIAVEPEEGWSAQWNPDGRNVVTISPKQGVRVWNAADGGEVGTPRFVAHEPKSLSLSPDGTRGLIKSSQATANLVTLPDDGVIATVKHFLSSDPMDRSSTWSPDGSKFVTRPLDGNVEIHEALTGGLSTTLSAKASGLSARWSRDGSRIATCSEEAVTIFDVASGGQLLKIPVGRYCSSVTWSPSNRSIVIFGSEPPTIWDTSNGNKLLTLSGYRPFDGSVAWNPDETKVAFLGTDGVARILNAADGAPLAAHPLDQGIIPSQLEWSPDGGRLAVASARGASVYVVAEDDGDATEEGNKSSSRHEPPPYSGLRPCFGKFTLSPDGSKLLSWGGGKSLWLTDSRTNSIIRELKLNSALVFTCWRPDGTQFVVAGKDGGVGIWNVDEAEPQTALRPEFKPNKAAWSPRSHAIVLVGEKKAELWSTSPKRMIASIDDIAKIEWSPDGTRFLGIGNTNSRARIFDGLTGDRLTTLASEAHYGSWSPDGADVMTWNSTNQIEVSDPSSGDRKYILKSDFAVEGAVWSPRGDRVAGWNEAGGKLSVWDARTTVQLDVFESPEVGQINFAKWDAAAQKLYVRINNERYRTADDRTFLPWSIFVGFQSLMAFERITSELTALWSFSSAPEPDYGLPRQENDCDALAAHPFDPNRSPGTGVAFFTIDGLKALKACDDAVAAEPNNIRYQYQRGRALSRAGRDSEAFAAFEYAKRAGYTPATLALASCYLRGEGTKHDLVKARSLYEEALSTGVVIAHDMLGRMIWDGEGGERDRDRAKAIWREGAARGDSGSHERLAWVAELGRDGAPPDLKAALLHYAIAVKLDDALPGRDNSWSRTRRGSLARVLGPRIAAAVAEEVKAYSQAAANQ